MNDKRHDSPDECAAAPDEEMSRVCSILERIAVGFSADSAERLAIRDAALAYTIVHQHGQLKQAYAKLRDASNGQLTEEMKNALRRRGLDPEELEPEQT